MMMRIETDEINETIHGCLLNGRHGLRCCLPGIRGPVTRRKVPSLQVLELGSAQVRISAVLTGTPKVSPAGAGLTLFLGSKLRRRITVLRHRSRCRRLRSD